ncbi:virulence associated lipoprotein (plasmid) [Borreliella turdi]|uniref:virulence associated lipoprotein n=1 Tax=Borreliella turdi TaxID=57863 RepID=UPI003AF1A13A
MKYNTIIGIFVFLFLLNSCNPDFNNVKQKKEFDEKTALKKEDLTDKGTAPKEQKARDKEATLKEEEERDKEAALKEQEARDKEAALKEEEERDKRIKNELIGDLRNLIEISNTDREKYVKKIEEEPENQYGIEIFKRLNWGKPSKDTVESNNEKSIEYRKFVYIALNDIDTNDLGEFSKILLLSGQLEILNYLTGFGRALDPSIVHLYSKKETLDKLDISDLEKLKNSFKELWSIKTDFSKTFNQLLLDYRNDNNLIKTDNGKLRSYVIALFDQIKEKIIEAEELVGKIISI